MDGISVRKPFPLGSLVLGPRDRVTTQKRQHERGGDANPHIWGSFSVCPALTPPPILYPFFYSFSDPLNSQTLCISVSPPNYSNLTTAPTFPSLCTPPSHPPPQSFTPKLKLHHRGLAGNPDTSYCDRRQRGFGWFCHPKWVFFSTGIVILSENETGALLTNLSNVLFHNFSLHLHT